MTVRRLGTPETKREGVVLEVYNGGRKVVLRGWHSGVLMIHPQHFSIEEIAHVLGLQLPKKQEMPRT